MYSKQKKFQIVVGFAAVVVVVGCSQKTQTTTQRTEALMDETLANPKAYLTAMVDNAMIHDMTMADMHFVPHTEELNGTGVNRLDRLALYLDTYGGKVRYETYSTDQEMIAQRMKHVHEYLELTGCDMTRVDIVAAISGGRLTPANQTIEAATRSLEVQAPSGIVPPAGGGGPGQ